jgi:4-carboxymuconolactone decarboxylase
MAESELFERGLRRRREVLGSDYVDASLGDSDEFMMAFQRAVTEVAWGWAWSRPGLDAKTRSMINLAMLTALGRFDELGIYVKGALRSGVTVAEIQEVLIHAIAYCGTPAGRQASWPRTGRSLRKARSADWQSGQAGVLLRRAASRPPYVGLITDYARPGSVRAC